MTQQTSNSGHGRESVDTTPAGTQHGQSGQGVLRNDPETQGDPQASNRDGYGDQETGATSGEVGDGRSPRQVAVSGSQPTQHSAGGSQQQDSERATGQRIAGQQEHQGGPGSTAPKLQGGPGQG